MTTTPTWHPISTAPRDWINELNVKIPEPVVIRSGRCIMVRGELAGEAVEEIVHWAQLDGTTEPSRQNVPHWFVFDAEPLGWEPTEWRDLTAEEEAALDAEEAAQ